MRDYEQLTEEWEDLLETLRCGEPDLEAIKHLIFDTYHFLKADLTGDSVPRDRLELYKFIGQVCQSLYIDYAGNMKQSESMRRFTPVRWGYALRTSTGLSVTAKTRSK